MCGEVGVGREVEDGKRGLNSEKKPEPHLMFHIKLTQPW